MLCMAAALETTDAFVARTVVAGAVEAGAEGFAPEVFVAGVLLATLAFLV
ncbi:hypothetical protein [Acetobacter fallax]|nr:hypothetical protein [Acetobacter fallax]